MESNLDQQSLCVEDNTEICNKVIERSVHSKGKSPSLCDSTFNVQECQEYMKSNNTSSVGSKTLSVGSET